jgi:hypothetical protein
LTSNIDFNEPHSLPDRRRLLSYALAAMWVVGSMCIDLMTKHGVTPNLVIAAHARYR